jgi:hypothetical protein
MERSGNRMEQNEIVATTLIHTKCDLIMCMYKNCHINNEKLPPIQVKKSLCCRGKKSHLLSFVTLKKILRAKLRETSKMNEELILKKRSEALQSLIKAADLQELASLSEIIATEARF